MTESIDAFVNQIHCGDVRDLPLPDSSVHCVVTSPSYFGLRDYGTGEQIGLEDSVAEYIDQLVKAGREIRRVLRPDGNWWLNLGDTFSGGGGVGGKPDDWEDLHDDEVFPDDPPARDTVFPRKCKMLIPQRIAIALIDDGWVCRGDPVWVKTNYKPHPVRDRLVERKEYVYHLTPEPMYWWDLEAIRKPHKQTSLERSVASFRTSFKGSHDSPDEDGDRESVIGDPEDALHPNGKNPGDVFVGTTSNYKGEHSATFPEWLVEAPIKSSCPPTVCADCGAPYERIIEESDREVAGGTPSVPFEKAGYKDRTGNHEGRREGLTLPKREVVGWETGCECDTEETVAGVVLDPFAGAGTTCVVAKRLGRRFVGFDIDPDSVAEAQQRTGVDVTNPERLDNGDSLAAFSEGGADD